MKNTLKALAVATLGLLAQVGLAATQTRTTELAVLATAGAPSPTAGPTATPIPPPEPTSTSLPPPTPTPTPVRSAAPPSGELLYASNKGGNWALYSLRPDGSGGTDGAGNGQEGHGVTCLCGIADVTGGRSPLDESIIDRRR